MSQTERIKTEKKYSNITLFEKRAKEFKYKKINKKFKYGKLKKLIRRNINFSIPVLSTSTTFIISDNSKQNNLKNKIFQYSLDKNNKSKKILINKGKYNNFSFKNYKTFYSGKSLNNYYRNKSSSILSIKNNLNIRKIKNKKSLIYTYQNRAKKINYSNLGSNIGFNYFLFHNFSNTTNADILTHFESEKNLSKLNNENMQTDVFFRKINNNKIKNISKLNRIKSAENDKKIIEYKNKMINLKGEDGNQYQYINKVKQSKQFEYMTRIKSERYLRMRENYKNNIESYNDTYLSLENTKKLFNLKFVEKMSNYIRFINTNIELEKKQNSILVKKIINYKNEIRQINNKIRKKIAERNNILKWIYFQIQLKEKKLILPSYYRIIIENINDYIKENTNTKENKVEKTELKRYYKVYRKVSFSERKSNNKIIEYDLNKENPLFYNCEIDFDDPVNEKEINRIKEYRNNLIFNSVDEFKEIFKYFQNRNIAMLKYYYKLYMKLFYFNREFLKIKNELNLNDNIYNNLMKNIKDEFNILNNDIKYKNKIIQNLNINKFSNSIFTNYYNKNSIYYTQIYNNNLNENKTILINKIITLYNTCKLLKSKNKDKEKDKDKDNKIIKKDTNMNLSNILSKLKYITSIVDYLFAQLSIYKSNKNGKNELLIKLKNEIEKNHKIQNAEKQRLKNKENTIKLQNKIEERNNKIYFLPYKKTNNYNNKDIINDDFRTLEKNKNHKIYFDDLLYN